MKTVRSKRAKSNPTTPEVLYPAVDAKLFIDTDSINADKARQLLGWQVEDDQTKFGQDYQIRNSKQEKVRLSNNLKNRPLYLGNINSLKQEILQQRWRFNGEPIIVGQNGLLLNGQHQLVALVLASEYVADHPEQFPDHFTPSIDKLVVFGIHETDEVVNTMDTCKPRSLTDVLYRSHLFSDLTRQEQVKAARTLGYAIRLLWERTGASYDAYRPLRTHSESLDFLARHNRLLEAVQHIIIEDGVEGLVNRYLSLGAASGLLYLMASSSTERENTNLTGYAQVTNPSEDQLDFSRWETACDFWVLLAANSPELAPVYEYLTELNEQGHGSFRDRTAVIVKAWESYVSGSNIVREDLLISHVLGRSGQYELVEIPVVGGIDIGKISPA